MEPRLGEVPPVTEPPLEIPPQLAEDFARVARLAEAAEDRISDFESSTNPERLTMLRDTGFMPLYMHLASLYTKAQSIADANPTEANQRLVTHLKQSIDTRVKDMAIKTGDENPSLWRSNLKAVVNELAGTPAVEVSAPIVPAVDVTPQVAETPVEAPEPTVTESPAAAVEAPTTPIEPTPEPEHPSVEWTEQLDAALQSLAPLPDPVVEEKPVLAGRPEEENWEKVEVSNEARERMGRAVAAATQAQKLLNSYNQLMQEPNPDQEELNAVWSAMDFQLGRLETLIKEAVATQEIPRDRINEYLIWLHSEVMAVHGRGVIVSNLGSRLNNIAQATNYVYAALSPNGVTDSGNKIVLAEPILPGMSDPEEPVQTPPTTQEQAPVTEQLPDEFTLTREQGVSLARLSEALADFEKTFKAFKAAEQMIRSQYGYDEGNIPPEQKQNINALYRILRQKGDAAKSAQDVLALSLVGTSESGTALHRAMFPAEQLLNTVAVEGIGGSTAEALAKYEENLNEALALYRSIMARKITLVPETNATPVSPDTQTPQGPDPVLGNLKIPTDPDAPINPEGLPATPEQIAYLRAINQTVGERNEQLTRKNLERGTKVLSMINGAIDKYKSLPKGVKWGITAAFIGGSVTVSMVSGGMPFWGALGMVLTKKAFNVVAGTAVGFTASKIIEKSIDMGMDAATKKWKPWFDKYPEATKFVRELRGVAGAAGGVAAGIWAAGLTPSGNDIVQFTSKVGDSVPNVPGFGLDEAARAVTDALPDQFDGPAGTGDAGGETTKPDVATGTNTAENADTTTSTEKTEAPAKADADAKAAAPAAAATPAEKTDAPADTAKSESDSKTTTPEKTEAAAKAPTDATSVGEKAAAVTRAAEVASTEIPSSAIAPETVEKGDTVWAMIREDMETRPELKDAFNALTPEEQNVAIDRIENRLQALSAAEVQELGITSGDLDLIREGEIVDLEKSIDASDLKDAVEGKSVEVPTTPPAEAPAAPTTAETPVEKPATAPVVTEPAVPKPSTEPVAATAPAPSEAPAPVTETAPETTPKPPEIVPGPEAGWTNAQTQNVMTSLVNHFVEQPKGGFLSGIFGSGADDAAAVSWLYGGAGEPTGINGTTIANLMSDKPEGPYTPQAITSMTGFLETITKGTGIDLNSPNWQNATVEEVTQAALSKGMELKTPWFTQFLNSADARGVRTLLGG